MSGKETQSPSSGEAATSHVDVNYFNPDGEEGLQRTISRMSAATQDIEQNGSSETLNAFDLRRVLEQVAEQREKVHLKSRELGVMFENLRVVGLGASASYQPTLGSTLNPLGIVEGIQAARHPHTRDILSGFEGVVYPGEMMLVLGRPGSGCTTLLKTLANQRGEYHAFEGDVHFDSLSHRDIFKNYRGDVVYCPEDDVHFPTLTVEQTIKFAAKLRAPHLRLGYSREDYAEHMTELLTTVFGLKHARKTLVGDAAIRGVSGGEKKRVSISEVLATRACVASWDNSTRGLDASTALEFVRALRIATDIAKMTTVVSLYQAGESLYKLFDKVCVIYEGKMAYYGPANEARSYFIDMGYEPANRQTTADFLVAVTDPNGRIPRSDALHLPRTAAEFVTYFQASSVSKWNKAEIQCFKAERVGKADMVQSYKESAREDHSKHTRLGSAHLTSLPMQARAVMIRRIQILRGNMLATVLNLFSFLFQGIIIGSVYLKISTSTNAYFSRGGVLFFALFFSALISMAEIPALYAQRPIILRQHSWALYHPFIDQVALVLVDIPMAFASSVIFSVLIYEMAQLQQSAGQFFIFFLFMFVVSITMKSWFRAVASAFAAEALAQTFAGISVLAYAVYTGYSLPLPSMIGALKWISYLNPLRWGFESVMTNEFRSINGSCGSLVPRGEGYEGVSLDNQVCPVVGAQSGQAFVDGNAFAYLSYDYRFSHTWRNFGIIIAFLVAYTTALLVFTEVNTKLTSANSVVLFKRGAKTDAVPKKNTDSDDTEKASQTTTRGAGLSDEDKSGDYDKALKATPSVTDVFSWQHLTYTVPVADGKRRLLNGVSGFVAPGKLTALMGESGAGKTTLLNVLAERASTGVITGDRFVNGQALPRDFQSQTGYCQQQDTHVGSATVREALLFSAQLRQPTSVSLSEKVEYVEKCIQLCGLEPFRDATVGSLSIENRKRTTIGVELAAKPKLLLFLDEPTSGLDSQSAFAIMLFLRDLADNGQAILCTIHQPSAELFQMFDRLLLLRKGGETVYFGDLGHNATTLIDYFQAHGSRRCEPEENPAEFMLDVIGAGASATSREDWHEIWCNSDEFTKVQGQIQEIHAKGRSQPPVGTTLHSEYATSWFHQVVQLVKRDASDHFRDPSYMMAKMALNIVSGLFLGFSFFKSKDTQQGTQNKLFSIFMSTIISVPLANQLQIPFLNMRSIYEIRERPSRMYNWTALVTSQIIVEVPWNIIGSSLYFFCWYWTSGFTSDRAGYSYLMIGVIFPLYYTTIGQSVAAMSPNAEIAAILFSFLFSFVLTFNGVVQPYRELGWWQWMYRLSPYTYLIEGVLGQAVGRQEVTCSSVELVTLNPPAGQTCGQYMQNYISRSGGYLTNPDASSACGFCSTRTTDEFLTNNFNIFYSHHWRNVGLMAAFILFNITAIFAFTFWFRIRTRSVLDMIRGRKAH